MKQTRSMRFLVLTAAAAAVTAGLGAGTAHATATSARGEGGGSAPLAAADVHAASENSGQVHDYWTPGRMSAARALFPPQYRSNATAPAPRDVLPPKSAPGTSAPAQAGSPGAAPLQLPGAHSQVWTQHGVMPATTVGTLYFVTNTGQGASCTATVINAPNHDTIWTAGHCVNDGSGHWYSHFDFVPDRHDGMSPFVDWSATKVAAPHGWTDLGLDSYDVGALALAANGNGKAQDVVGSQGYKFGYGYEWSVYAFGYPANLWAPYRRTDVEQLRYCTGNTWKVGIIFTHEGFNCDMGHGSSGGPWLSDLQLGRGWGYIVGNNNEHVGDNNSLETRSPHLGDQAINTYNAVDNG